MGRYLELAKEALQELAQSHRASHRVSKPDPFAALMEGTLSKINRPDYSGGMIPWLEQAAPALYAELTSRIPDEIDQIWNEHESLDEFEAALDRLVAVHREACRLYREDQARRKLEVIGHSEPIT
jgi:hypothetical protein